MYLKRLEMTGFKSFAEKTQLDFEPGITGIVGPNGCGKSNVVDALRWCLGEMSAKSLRSKVLLDVIFNGSANRTPSHMAEVSLTFDNSQNRLPIDYSEVTITRRLFRSGDSEYYLNKAPCRLKDIRDLLLDTGIGEEGYSIIEQGRVEYLLNARPEERRELFEEAAGVSKYKARREEALRKMERTQLDLDRLNDVIALTKEQMDKIESAVKKARQYQKLLGDLRDMEIAHALFESAQLEMQMDSMGQAVQVIEHDLVQKTTDVHSWEARLTELRYQETQMGERLVSLNRRLADIDGAVSLAELKQTTARERETEILRREAVLDQELSQGASRLEELRRLWAEAQAAEESQRHLQESLTETLQRSEELCREKIDSLKAAEARLADWHDALWHLGRERETLSTEQANQKGLEARLATQNDVLSRDRQQAQEKLEVLQRRLSEMDQQVTALADESASADAKAVSVREMLTMIEAAHAQLAADKAEARTAEDRARALLEAQQSLASSHTYARGAQAILEHTFPGLRGPLGRLLEVPETEAPLIRRALGDVLNALVADTAEQARAALSWLSQQGRGRARVLILENIVDSVALPGSLADRVTVEASLQPALKRWLGRWTLSQGFWSEEGLLEGGSAEEDVAYDALREEQLRQTAVRLTEARLALEDRQRDEGMKLKEAQLLAEETRKSGEALQARLRWAQQEQERERAQREVLVEEMRWIDEEVRKISEEDQRVSLTAQSLAERLKTLEEQEANLRSDSQSLQEALQSRRGEAMEASSALAEIREKLSTESERQQWRQQQRQALEQDLRTLEGTLAQQQIERAGTTARIAEQRRLAEEAQAQSEKLWSERHSEEKALETLQAERLTLHTSLADAERALAEIRILSEEMRNQLQDKKLQLNHARFRRESFEAMLAEKYKTTLEAERAARPLPESPVVTAELERLRKRTESLGAVNLAAPEEHQQLQERYQFLTTQQADLVKAKEDLTRTIQKINATTRQHFAETFEKVRENFRALYGKLFQGGEADLRLTDEADLLNSGIEIFAQPPGKKLQNITLLSGGEKALTAVALLFSFFLVRPAPFAVMDEVDAPLDEANVGRYVSMIKSFTDRSQFLLITHNKRSMESADHLYGVTMETLGVSRILSARLRRSAQELEPVSSGVAEGDSL